MEFLIVIAFFGYIYYLRNHADLRTRSEKDEENLKEGIRLYKDNQIQMAYEFFDDQIKTRPNSSVAYLYRARCHKEQCSFHAAMDDLNTGLSYDESVYGLHLEKGKLLLRNGMYDSALKAFNKAIFNGGDQDPEPYYWRAMTKQHLHQDEEAQKDFDKEAEILNIRKSKMTSDKPQKKPFNSKKFFTNSALVALTSTILIYVIKQAEGIHLPYLLAAISAVAIGFAEPHKGWILALIQCTLLVGGYFLFTELPQNQGKAELENFSLYGSAVLIFAGSFLGAFLKRAIKGI